jgi:hypothetical protein
LHWARRDIELYPEKGNLLKPGRKYHSFSVQKNQNSIGAPLAKAVRFFCETKTTSSAGGSKKL